MVNIVYAVLVYNVVTNNSEELNALYVDEEAAHLYAKMLEEELRLAGRRVKVDVEPFELDNRTIEELMPPEEEE